MLHVCRIFVWIMIKMQWLPLIWNGKSTDKALFCLFEDIYFICDIYLIWSLFDLELLFSFVVYIYIIFTFLLFSRGFYPKRLPNEDNRINQNQQKSNTMQVLY